MLLGDLMKADTMSIAVDESTDKTDTAQLCIYVRFFDGKCFREELLGLLPLEGHTTADIVFGKISAFFKDSGLDMKHVCMLVTDGAPSMTGKVNGLAARWSAVAPQLISLHCIVHQAVLCAKLSGALKTTMDSVMAIINFIRSTSSVQHRLFRMLLSEMSAEHHDLLLHNDVSWLSKGKALERFCGLREEIITFLRGSKQKKAETHLSRILDDNFMADACFLSDIFKHLNDLNLGLQGRDKTVIDLVEQMRAFQVKLDLFANDLSTGRMLHFPTLRKCISSPAQITDVMTDFIAMLKNNFVGRLDGLDLPTELAVFVRDPFTVAIEGDLSARAKKLVPSIDEGKFTLELVDMQSSVTMAQELSTNGPAMFWTDVNAHQFPNIKKVAIVMLSMFGSTYTLERVNSFKYLGVHITQDLSWSWHINTVVKKARQRLYHLRRLRDFRLPSKVLRNFYSCTIESILTGNILTWFGNSTMQDRRALQRVVRSAERTIHTELPDLHSIYSRRCWTKARKIVKDLSHPNNGLFSLMRSGKRFRSLKANTERLRRSFFPQAIRSLNQYITQY
ncbi:SCAN domain-containing 3-like isoform X2 [Labeo rohita]|uniref:SCAN domain-containing 3-like isoform X2 n=1 Tax=Labeo rohita TaxID=84645 RepID=A0A498P404_LABRO|nr:SCAN domain-containing 3-like isoform X2 [Labeo rohita]